MEPQNNIGKENQEDLQEFMPTDEDLLYEEELLRNPYNLRMWQRYLDARKDASPKKRYLLYERALRALPGSYKVCPKTSCCFDSCAIITDSLLRFF